MSRRESGSRNHLGVTARVDSQPFGVEPGKVAARGDRAGGPHPFVSRSPEECLAPRLVEPRPIREDKGELLGTFVRREPVPVLFGAIAKAAPAIALNF